MSLQVLSSSSSVSSAVRLLLRAAVGPLALALMAASAQAQVAVVVNAKSPVASLSAEQVASIFTGRSATLPSGAAAQPADLPEANALREQFYSKAAGKSSSQVKAIWARLTFSGKGTPPKELPSAAEVKKYVAANADAIGYIEKSAVDDSVKVVLTLP